VDISDYAVANPLPECAGRIFHGDAMELPYSNQTFDWVITWSLLEHIPENLVTVVLKELRRVGKMTFVQIAIPLFPGHEEQLRKEDSTHITLKPYAWWESKMKQAGLEIVWYDQKMSMILRPKVIESKKVLTGDKVLVSIPTKDRLKPLRKLLESLEKQTFKNWDVVIVDDSKVSDLPGDSGVNEMLNRIYSQGHSWLAVRGVGQNQAVAHNRMLNHALANGYKLMFRVDDDITLEPDFLEKCFAAFLADEQCKLAAVGGIFLSPFAPAETQQIPPNWRELYEFRGKVEPPLLQAQVFVYPDDIEYRDDIDHLYSSYMFRPELVADVGGFPQNLSAMGFREETLPLYELKLKGYRLMFITKAIGYHWNEQDGGLRSVKDTKKRDAMYLSDEAAFQKRLSELKRKYGVV